jgi:hypothetical protein
VITVEEGSPLEEIITTWSEDGIALVLPVDPSEEGGTTGATHKKRTVKVLNLDQARTEAQRRDTMRKTSLDASEIPHVPNLKRSRDGGSSLKAGILSLDKVPRRRGAETPTSLGEEILNAEMEKLGSNPPPGEKEMMPLPSAAQAPAPSEPEPVEIESGEEAEDEKLAAAENEEAKTRAEKLDIYAERIDDLTKSDIMILCEKLGINDVKPAMLKADLVQAAAAHLIAEGIDINDVIE